MFRVTFFCFLTFSFFLIFFDCWFFSEIRVKSNFFSLSLSHPLVFQFEVVEGKDGAIVKDSEGRVIREEEVKKSRKSNKEHQMIHKVKPEDEISHEDAEPVEVKAEQVAPEPSPRDQEKEKKKKKGLFW